MLASSLTVKWKRYCFMVDKDLEMKYRILNFLSTILRTCMWSTTSTTMKKSFKEKNYLYKTKRTTIMLCLKNYPNTRYLGSVTWAKVSPWLEGYPISSPPSPSFLRFKPPGLYTKNVSLTSRPCSKAGNCREKKFAIFPRKLDQIKLVKLKLVKKKNSSCVNLAL